MVDGGTPRTVSVEIVRQGREDVGADGGQGRAHFGGSLVFQKATEAGRGEQISFFE
jgi:hypothetical protein